MNKLEKDCSGSFYRVRNGSGKVVALLVKSQTTKGGYNKLIQNNVTGKWFNPSVFGYFPTLSAAKRYYDIK